MRYKLNNLEIRTENAAKPISQRSKLLVSWLEGQETVRNALDYGCGKLRYAGTLAQRCENLTLVDSEVQINRRQVVDDVTTTIREYATAKWPHSRVLTTAEFKTDSRKYDLILCANVLSAIPKKSVRSRTLRQLAATLKKRGVCLFVTQFRNTYFRDLSVRPNATSHLDGWILENERGNSYYGILDKNKIIRIVSRQGFAVIEAWHKGESAFVLTRKSRNGR